MYIINLNVDLVCRWPAGGPMQAVDEEIAMELSARHRIWKTVFPEITAVAFLATVMAATFA